MQTRVVSFFTPGSYYPAHAQRLQAELDGLGVPYVIMELPDAGGYLKNTCMKPTFIRQMLETLRGPVLWVDVDASMHQPPSVMDMFQREGYDLALRPIEHPARSRKFHVGTVWVNYTPKALKFVADWEALALGPSLTDEAALAHLERAGQLNDLRLHMLPASYFVLDRHPPTWTVIQHRISNHARKRAENPRAELDERRHG